MPDGFRHTPATRALTEMMWRGGARIFGCWQGLGEGAGLKTLQLSRNEAKNQKDRCSQI